MKKTLWPIFSGIIACDRPQKTFFKGPEGILTITVEGLRYFFVENKFFWKKTAIFQKKKFFWPSFSPIIGCDKRQGTVYESPKGNLTKTVEVKG